MLALASAQEKLLVNPGVEIYTKSEGRHWNVQDRGTPGLGTSTLKKSPGVSHSLELGAWGCLGLPGPCKPTAEGTWALGNWSAEADAESGGHEPEQGAMLSTVWETEGLQTLGIVVIVCAALKLLHLLGLISFSEGKRGSGWVYEFRHVAPLVRENEIWLHAGRTLLLLLQKDIMVVL
ncbi:hypothetical protein MHYP_G00009290 [Metynnis hypsauchen]